MIFLVYLFKSPLQVQVSLFSPNFYWEKHLSNILTQLGSRAKTDAARHSGVAALSFIQFLGKSSQT
jgi:hypothetical protein